MATLDDISIGGELVGADRGRVLRFPAGRVCDEPGCTTRLSIYNSHHKCATHDFDPSLLNFRSPPHVTAGARHAAPVRRQRRARAAA